MPPIFRKIYWTEHSKIKMKQYGLSVSKILGILRKPERKEKAIVPGLIAVMRTNPAKSKKVPLPFLDNGAGKKFIKWEPTKNPGEIWIMYKDIKIGGERKNPSARASTELSRMSSGQVRKIISAWRYPGITKPGEEIPIPEDTLMALKENGELQ